MRTGARVERILLDGSGRRVAGVRCAGGEQIAARRVVTTVNPQTALLDLLGGAHLPGRLVRRLSARHRSNAAQFVVHAALDHLPVWPGASSNAWRGLQWVAGSLEQVAQNFLEAEAGTAPREPAVYLYTPSPIDETLAPPGKHTAYTACPSYPARFADASTWRERGAREADRLLNAIEVRAPGFRQLVKGVAWRHAEDWEAEIGLLGGHPMHLDITQDQVGSFRPLPELAGHHTPIGGLYLSGAGTYPTGGVSAVPGRSAAKALLHDLK